MIIFSKLEKFLLMFSPSCFCMCFFVFGLLFIRAGIWEIKELMNVNIFQFEIISSLFNCPKWAIN